jgi:2-oxoglutarate-Fe(II)-dependent oxygenase superfamily protein
MRPDSGLHAMIEAPPSVALEQVVDYARLEASAADFRARYDRADPWPHLVIENILRSDVAMRAAIAYPPLGKLKSVLARFFEAREYDGCIDRHDPIFRAIFDELHGSRFTAVVEKVAGIDGLVPDTTMAGAGLHQGGRGSYLRLHADHNTHPLDDTRYRRVNVLIYLNEIWDAQWNGDLELWDRQAGSCQKRIAPVFNRCVISEVSDTSFHGYDSLRLPRNRTRKALAAYYYAAVPAPGQAAEPHSEIWPALPRESFASYWKHRLCRAVVWRIENRLSR